MALRENGQAIGICGILKRAGLDLPDLGFAFLPAFEGQGFAREAATATLEFAENQLGIHELLAITTEANLRSQRLLQATGFVHNGEVILPGETETLMLFGRKSLIFR